MKTINQNTPDSNLEKLVQGLKNEDASNLKLTTGFAWVMWLLAPVYLLLAIIEMIREAPSLDNLGFIFFSLGFFAFGLLFRSLKNDYQAVDYGIPTVEMLHKAAQRYKFWQLKTFLTIIPMLLVCLATSFSLQDRIPNPDLMTRIILVFIGYFLFLCVGIFIGYLVWRKKQKPLRDHALVLLKEIEG